VVSGSFKGMGDSGGNAVIAGSLNISPEIMRRLSYLADIRDKDISEVLAEAVGLEEEFVNAIRSGGKMLIAHNGTIEELIPPQRIPSQPGPSERRPRM
jgi:hypothetical protein